MDASGQPPQATDSAQPASELQHRASGDATASSSAAAEQLMALLRQRMAASSEMPVNLGDALSYREDDETDKQAAERAAQDPFVVSRLEELFDEEVFNLAEEAGRRLGHGVPASAMIMRKLYAIGDQAEKDAEQYSPETENDSRSASPAAQPSGTMNGAAEAYSLASSEAGDGAGPTPDDSNAANGNAQSAGDGEPDQQLQGLAAQSGGSSGTGLGEPGRTPEPGTPDSVAVICNGVRGVFHIAKQVMECRCRSCEAKAERDGAMVTMTPTEFERHAGMAASKKWKYTVRIDDGTEDPQPVGAWLESRGLIRQSERTVAAKRGGLTQADVAKAASLLPTRPPSSRSANSQYRRGSDGKFQTKPAPKPRFPTGAGRRHVSLTAAAGVGRGGGSGSDLNGGDAAAKPEASLRTGSGTPRARQQPKRWLEASSAQVHHAHEEEEESDQDVVELREGPQHQAVVPPLQQPKPSGACTDPRAGLPGPSLEDALASAAGKERAVAEALPPDAIQDVIAAGPRSRDLGAPLERGSRVKRRPHWLNNTVDPALAAANRIPLQDGSESSLGGSAPAGALGGGLDDAQSRLNEGGPRPAWGGKARRAESDAGALWVKGEELSEPPQVVNWRMTHYGVLEATLVLHGRTFRGELAPTHRVKRAAEVSPQQPPPKRLGRPPKQPQSAPPVPPLSTSPSNLPPVVAVPQPSHPDAVAAAAAAAATTAGLRRAASAAAATLGTKEEVNAERRAASDREYMRMAQDGAPPDAKCTLCSGGASTAAEVTSDEFGARADGGGLGPWLLVRVSAITNAWIHEQCARWSPEVYETDDGLQMVPEAVRRGRKIKCRECGLKGATLGCLNRFCRSSFHLNCARACACELQGDPYKVMCPQHRSKGTGYTGGGLQTPSTLAAPPPQPPHPHHQQPHQRQQQQQQLPTPSPSPMAKAPDGGSGDMSNYFRSPPPRPSPAPRASPAPKAAPAAVAAAAPVSPPLVTAAPAAQAAAAQAAAAAKPDDRQPRNGSSGDGPPGAASEPDISLGGTVGQCRWRPGRCQVCVVQRKGKCGTATAPRSCLRRKAHGTLATPPPPPQQPYPGYSKNVAVKAEEAADKARQQGSMQLPQGQQPPQNPQQPQPTAEEIAQVQKRVDAQLADFARQRLAAVHQQQYAASLPPPLQPPGPVGRPGPVNSSLGSLQQQLVAAARNPSTSSGFPQTLPSMASGPFHVAPTGNVPASGGAGPSLPPRQQFASQLPQQYQLPQLRPPLQYQPLSPQQSPQRQPPPQQSPQRQLQQQQAAMQRQQQQQQYAPRPQQQQQQQQPLSQSPQQQQAQYPVLPPRPQQPAGSSATGGGAAQNGAAVAQPALTFGPVLPPVVKKKRT